MFDIEPITSLKPTDCGATCMQMLLKYYGIDVDLDTLIAECHVGIAGCNGKDLRDCGNAHGLDIRLWQDKDPNDLSIFTSDRPAIVWWKYNHFCMYCGIDENDKVVIINPDRGRYRMSKKTFAMFFTDIYITNGEPIDIE